MPETEVTAPEFHPTTVPHPCGAIYFDEHSVNGAHVCDHIPDHAEAADDREHICSCGYVWSPLSDADAEVADSVEHWQAEAFKAQREVERLNGVVASHAQRIGEAERGLERSVGEHMVTQERLAGVRRKLAAHEAAFERAWTSHAEICPEAENEKLRAELATIQRERNEAARAAEAMKACAERIEAERDAYKERAEQAEAVVIARALDAPGHLFGGGR
jgi:hypothetical protein